MTSSLSAQIALLAFAAAIAAGLYAGNSTATVLIRALIAMFVGFGVGKLASWTGKLVLRDHLQRKKLAIDRAQGASEDASQPQQPDKQSQTVEAG